MRSGAKTGKLGRGLDGFDPAAYAPVAERINLFYGAFPTGRIITELVSRTDQGVVFKALVYRGADVAEPAATGWASEREGDGDVNAVACLENTETSAIGRALANLGFTASRQRPSVEEMTKASRARVRLETGRAVREPADPDRVLLADLTLLVARAQRAGLRPARARRWLTLLQSGSLAHDALVLWERQLRHWIQRQRERQR